MLRIEPDILSDDQEFRKVVTSLGYKKMCIRDRVKRAHDISVKHGFWEKDRNFGEVIALMLSLIHIYSDSILAGRYSRK